MRMRAGLLALFALALPAAGLAQDPSAQQRMDRFEQRLNEMEQRHQAELKVRDDEIARLRALVEQKTPPQPPTAPGQTPQPATRQDEIEKARQDVLKDIESRSAPGADATDAGQFQSRPGPL